ncbi:methyltransferase [Spirillospora sp. NPDC047279]|uniref:methyltransferase n=1 Tax=Spirillospora sp. NPDC047279 TaxID=3155478 RepID=UPI0033DC620C
MAQPSENPEATPGAEARAMVMRLVFGGMAVQVVGVAARLNLPDEIGPDDATVTDLAGTYGFEPVRMTRLLRALAGLQLCREVEPGRFRLTDAGHLLRQGHPASVHRFVLMFTDPVMLGAWPRLETALRTGRTQFDEVFGQPFFDYLTERPEKSAVFNDSMSQATSAVAAVLPGLHDFGRYRLLMDIGGGDGTLLTAVLRDHPGLRGRVFDTAPGAAQAGEVIGRTGLAGRCEVAHGDFFGSVPGGADAHLLKSILHDWDDARVVTILRHSRAALPGDGTLLIVEPVLPETVPEEGMGGIYLSDLNMLVNVGGRERTRTEFEHVCREAGFTVTAVTPLAATGFSLIEAVPAA